MSGFEFSVTLVPRASAWIFGPLAGLPTWHVTYRYVEPAWSEARARYDGCGYSEGARLLYSAFLAITRA